MKICTVLGTRPEIIKMIPVIKACKENRFDHILVHTGQHYSYALDKIFFKELSINEPDYTLEVGSGTHGKQTARILEKCEKVFMDEKPDIILVEGDTNTVVGAALAATKIHIKVGHVEAGLRSYDREMPEEINRVLTDHISDYCFAPTKGAKNNLLGEGIKTKKIFVTGNTIVDALFYFKEAADKKSHILEKMSLDKKNYVLVTAHRQENVDSKIKLANIIQGLTNVNKELGIPVVYPTHPRTLKMLDRFQIEKPEEIIFTDPIGYLDFLKLQNNARLIITDSGGIQEESCILGVPCVTLRENTERPETLDIGSNILTGTDPVNILESAKKMIVKKHWENPFGDGTAGKQIIDILK